MSIPISFLIVGISILLSAFFSSCEIAYTSLNRMRLDTLADKGSSRAKIARRIANRYECTLSSILIGNNLVNNIASTVATTLALTWASTVTYLTEGIASTIAGVAITVAILIFGEIIPKIIAKLYPLGYAMTMAYPLYIISLLFFPISYPVSCLIRRVTNRNKDTFETMVTEEELSYIFENAEEEGALDEDKGELLQSALEYQATTVEDILVPRIALIGIDLDDSPEQIRKQCMESPYSRLPVYRDSLDNILGILSVTHYLKASNADLSAYPAIEPLMNEPLFVYKTAKLPVVFRGMQDRRTHMALVLDEYGGTMGIVTMEDILEEIVGDIWDEYDDTPEEDFVEVGEDAWDVDGMTNIDQFFEDIDFEDKRFDSDSTTMGGWAMEMLNNVPSVGDSFTYRNLTITVTELRDNLVGKLHVTREEEEEDDDE